MRIKPILVTFIAAAMSLLTSCMDITKPTEQTLEGKFQIVWDSGSGLSPELFAVNALKEQFPDAQFDTTKFMSWNYSQSGVHPIPTIYDIAEEDVPGDLIMFESTLAPYLFKSGYLEPLDIYMDTSSNLSGQIQGRQMDIVREQGGGQIYGIPFGKNVYALYYNADIFNELDIPAPTDGMTWDEVFSLARQISEHPSRGNRAALKVPDKHLVYSQFDIRVLDSEGMPNVDNERWERAAQLFGEMSELEKFDRSTNINDVAAQFYDQQIAMIASRYLGDSSVWGNNATSGFSAPLAMWDMVSFPVFADAPGTGPAPAYYYLGIPKNSTRKKEAFQLVSYLLSDEPQMNNSRNGMASVLNSTTINSQFGEWTGYLGGKNVSAFFRYPKEGTLDPEYDWDMQSFFSSLFAKETQPSLNDFLQYKQKQLDKVGALRE